MLTNNAQVVQFYSAPLACFADALDIRIGSVCLQRMSHPLAGYFLIAYATSKRNRRR